MIDQEDFLRIMKTVPGRTSFALGEVTADSPLKIKLDGYGAALQKSFKRLDGYTPAVGDRVLVAVVGHSHVVLGKIA